MNVIDIVIIILFLAGFVTGFRRGLIMQVAAILGAFIALAVAKAEYRHFAHFVHTFASSSRWSLVISYLVIFFVVWSLVTLVARVARTAARLLLLGFFDRILGAVLGLLQAAVVVEVLLYLGKRTPSHTLRVAISHSALAPGFTSIIPFLNHLFPQIPK
jgi:membrane protein required for colicin V production